jgi:hypothetical protein
MNRKWNFLCLGQGYGPLAAKNLSLSCLKGRLGLGTRQGKYVFVTLTAERCGMASDVEP